MPFFCKIIMHTELILRREGNDRKIRQWFDSRHRNLLSNYSSGNYFTSRAAHLHISSTDNTIRVTYMISHRRHNFATPQRPVSDESNIWVMFVCLKAASHSTCRVKASCRERLPEREFLEMELAAFQRRELSSRSWLPLFGVSCVTHMQLNLKCVLQNNDLLFWKVCFPEDRFLAVVCKFSTVRIAYVLCYSFSHNYLTYVNFSFWAICDMWTCQIYLLSCN